MKAQVKRSPNSCLGLELQNANVVTVFTNDFVSKWFAPSGVASRLDLLM